MGIQKKPRGLILDFETRYKYAEMWNSHNPSIFISEESVSVLVSYSVTASPAQTVCLLRVMNEFQISSKNHVCICWHLGRAIVFCHKNQNKEYKARRLLLPQGLYMKLTYLFQHFFVHESVCVKNVTCIPSNSSYMRECTYKICHVWSIAHLTCIFPVIDDSKVLLYTGIAEYL